MFSHQGRYVVEKGLSIFEAEELFPGVLLNLYYVKSLPLQIEG